MFTIIFPSRKEEMRRIIERNKCREETRNDKKKKQRTEELDFAGLTYVRLLL